MGDDSTFFKRPCPLCGTQDSVKLNIGEPVERVGHNVLCSICGLMYHNPVMTAKAMARFYSEDYVTNYRDSEVMSQALATQRVNLLKKYIDVKTIAPALEIGAAYGAYLLTLNNEGIKAHGIEPSRKMAEWANTEKNLDVIANIYESVPERPGYFGSIHLFHVLEHVLEPHSTLERIRRELREDGVLYLAVPTINAPQLAMVYKMIHPTVFVPETLQKMLEVVGFKIILLEEKGHNIHVIARPSIPNKDLDYANPKLIFSRAENYLSKREQIVNHIHETLDDIKDAQNIAIYGAGHNTTDLDRIYCLDGLSITGIYDNDPNKQGIKLLGHSIQSPKALEKFNGDAVIISSYAFQEEISEQLSYLKKRGVKLVQLYEKN